MSLNSAKVEELLGVLEKINSSLERIERKLDEAIALQRSSSAELRTKAGTAEQSLDVMTLLAIPDHLRKTAVAVCRLGRATASDISRETGRARAVESGYLNQLVVMGYLRRGRKGRDVYFYA